MLYACKFENIIVININIQFRHCRTDFFCILIKLVYVCLYLSSGVQVLAMVNEWMALVFSDLNS